MRNPRKIFIVLVAIFAVETGIYFIYKNSKISHVEQLYRQRMDTESFNEGKEKKKLNDEFEKNKYLATGKDAYERIYNDKQQDITDLVQKLGLEAFPNSWNLEVKVEEFTNVILLIQVDKTNQEPTANEIAKYLEPMLASSGKYLKNVAVYNRKHQCYLFFDEYILGKIVKQQVLDDVSIAEIIRSGEDFTKYNAVKIEFQEQYGHMLIPVIVAGDYGSNECTMMLDTGASMTVISLELAQKTGREDLNNVSRKSFSTAKGSMSCPIVEREIVVAGLDKKQKVAVNIEDDTNLLGVDFFEGKGYIIDNTSKCIYVWSK